MSSVRYHVGLREGKWLAGVGDEVDDTLATRPKSVVEECNYLIEDSKANISDGSLVATRKRWSKSHRARF